MSAQDRQAERLAADLYEAVRPLPADHGPLYPRAKRFGEAVLTGYALAAVWRKLRH